MSQADKGAQRYYSFRQGLWIKIIKVEFELPFLQHGIKDDSVMVTMLSVFIRVPTNDLSPKF